MSPLIRKLPVLVMHAHARCNCRCLMCDIWKTTSSRSLTPAELTRHLPDMLELGVETVAFTGGEPLMNPNLPELCALLDRAGIRVTILTTGLLLERHANQLVKHTTEIIVSLDGPRPVHDAIRRVPGAYDQLAAGIAAVARIDSKFPVLARCTVQRMNASSLVDTASTARSLGLKSISFLAADIQTPEFNRGADWTADDAGEVALDADDLVRLEAEIERLIDQRGTFIEAGFIVESDVRLRRIVRHFKAHLGLADAEAPRCNAPWVSAVIELDGSVRPCFFQPAIGELSAGLKAAVNNDRAAAFRSALDIKTDPICRNCVCSLYRSP